MNLIGGGPVNPDKLRLAFDRLKTKISGQPEGRTFVPKYDEEGFINPPGMDARQAWDARRAYYQQRATPADTERPDPKALAELQEIEGESPLAATKGDTAKKRGGTEFKEPGMGFARHSELEDDAPVATKVETRKMDEPELRTDFAAYMAKKYPKGSTREQQMRGAAEFLRGDTARHIDPRLLEEFLNRDSSGGKKKQPKPFTVRELRRAEEIDL